jgi:hypothetical protein
LADLEYAKAAGFWAPVPMPYSRSIADGAASSKGCTAGGPYGGVRGPAEGEEAKPKGLLYRQAVHQAAQKAPKRQEAPRLREETLT